MKRRNSILLAICAVILLLAGTATGVYAKYVRQASDVKNEFQSAVSINPTVSDGMTNVDIAVGETKYPVYVRATIVVTWQNRDGIVHFTMPVAGSDYSLVLNSTDWQEIDGYYYCKQPVASSEKTPVLIESCTPKGNPPTAGYTLHVEVAAQTVQAVGTTDIGEKPAYQDAWGISLNG